MRTFEQFLLEKEKMFTVAKSGMSHQSKLVSPVNPARPAKLVYSGLNVQKILPVPRCGRSKSGVIGSDILS